jgi:D-arabinose 1-dehydrogenase-like Zn-dependent alcohol dehydrogenase
LVLKVHSCGVCFHDVLTRNGTLKAGVRLPCVLGHEVAGTVVELGAQVKGFKLGDRVATTQRSYICGHCRFCRSGFEPLCAQRVFLGDVGLVGGYAQYLAISSDCIAQVPDGVDLDHAAVAACAVGTVLNAVRDVGRVQMGETLDHRRRRRLGAARNSIGPLGRCPGLGTDDIGGQSRVDSQNGRP